MGKHRQYYTAGFKLQVVKYAEECSKQQTQYKFNIDEKCARHWHLQMQDLTEIT